MTNNGEEKAQDGDNCIRVPEVDLTIKDWLVLREKLSEEAATAALIVIDDELEKRTRGE